VVKLQWRLQIEARARSHQNFAVDTSLVESRRKFQASAVRPRSADGGDGHCLLGRRQANGHLVAHRKTAHVADFEISRAGNGICCEIRVASLRAYVRNRDGLNPMADRVDV
jgi:hypothetical protein